MKVTAVSWPRLDLWPRPGLVRLLDQLVISTDTHGDLWIPRGFRSDGASVPAPLWGLLAALDSGATPLGLLLMGIGHDAAYRIDARWSMGDGTASAITRPEADELARALARYSGRDEDVCAAIRYGLGVGAQGSWHRKRLDWRPA